MPKWEMVFCNLTDVGEYLNDGWEPFAVTCLGNPDFALVWLRRRVD